MAGARACYNYLQKADYYPYGMPWRTPETFDRAEEDGTEPREVVPDRYLFGGKEYLSEDGRDEYYFLARNYIPSLPRFDRHDPKAEDYTPYSPYLYCAGNPVNAVDPDGKKVIADNESQKGIINGLDEYEQRFVDFNEYGILDIEKLKRCNSDSYNFKILKVLCNSDVEYIFTIADEVKLVSESRELSATTEEAQTVGVTQMPNVEGEFKSPDNKVYITSSSKANPEKRATNIAHKAYEHAYFSELKRTNPDIDPLHRYKNEKSEEMIYDEEFKVMTPVFILKPSNILLENRIKQAESEALKNFRSNQKNNMLRL